MTEPATVAACGAGFEGCDCDLISDDVCDFLGLPRGSLSSHCECHDCHICGYVECDGHPTA